MLEVLYGYADTEAASGIADCYAFFNDAVVDYLRKSEDRHERCQDLLNTLEKKMETAALLLDPSEQPNVVFETLNARAERLKQSELVKNTIMYEGAVVEDEERSKILWNVDFEDQYWREEKDGASELDYFLSDWLTARLERRIAPNRVAPEFRSYLQSTKAAGREVEYLTDRLNPASKVFREVYCDRFQDSMPSSQRLLDMGIGAVMPIILWLWDPDNSVDRRERQVTLRIIESYVIRRILANLNVGATLMNTMVSLLYHLHNANEQAQRHSDAIRDALSSITIDSARWPKDEEIKQKLTTMPHGMSVTRQNVVLTALENRLRRDNGKPPLDFKVHTAPLMPASESSLSNGYPLTGRATESRLRRRRERVGFLGNLTLTRTRMTAKQRELPWAEKRELLENHRELELNRQLLDKSDADWTEDAIEDRTVIMVELAIKTWPHSTE